MRVLMKEIVALTLTQIICGHNSCYQAGSEPLILRFDCKSTKHLTKNCSKIVQLILASVKNFFALTYRTVNYGKTVII